MSILSEMATYLDSKPNVRAALNGRIFAGRAPQTIPMPYVLLTQLGAVHEYATTGEITEVQPTIQVDVFARGPKGHLTASVIAERIRDAMSGYVGVMGTTTVQGCTIERDNELVDLEADGSDDWVYQRSIDYRLTHAQTAPAL